MNFAITSCLRHGRPFVARGARPFMGWLNAIFNKVDTARIAEAGADRACAEWLLRCGATVRWRGSAVPLADYNSLPVGDYRRLKIEEVDATDAAVMEVGFPHFQGLTEFKKIKLRNCIYVTDDSLKVLVTITKQQVEWMEVSKIGSVTDAGVVYLRKMEKLSYLKLEDLPGVEDPHGVLKRLKTKMPKCKVEWPPYTEVDDDQSETEDTKK